ncbi:MAG: hypothetical protein ABL951_11505 [Alphaproteobacteria bacterium]
MSTELSYNPKPLGVTDKLFETLKRFLREEPVAMSVALAFVAAAFTNSIAAFAITGVLSWFSAKRLLILHQAENDRKTGQGAAGVSGS